MADAALRNLAAMVAAFFWQIWTAAMVVVGGGRRVRRARDGGCGAVWRQQWREHGGVAAPLVVAAVGDGAAAAGVAVVVSGDGAAMTRWS